MKTEHDEMALRRRFQELREEDERRVPTCRIPAMRSADVRLRPPIAPVGWRWAVGLAAALVVLAAAGPVLWRSLHPATPDLAGQWAVLSEWEAPTDFLLQSPELAWNMDWDY